jgi:hypothetical protein
MRVRHPKKSKQSVARSRKMSDATSSLHKRLSKIAHEIARAPKTGKKADKKFFDALSEG